MKRTSARSPASISRTDAIDYREGDDPTHVRKLPGLTKYGNVTLKRGITDSMDLYNWYKDVVAGKIKRATVAIVVQNEAGQRRGALRDRRGLALEVRPDGSQREGQRCLHRNAGAHQRRRRPDGRRRTVHAGGQVMAFETEVQFTLPKGYLATDGMLHKEGVMRLATAADEILPLKDPRVQQNPAYLTVILLSRVVTRLGGLAERPSRRHRGALRLGPVVPAGALPEPERRRRVHRGGGVPQVRAPLRREVRRPGGSMKGYPLKELHEEMAFIAYYFHWPWAEIMQLPHARSPAVVRGDLAHQSRTERRAEEHLRRARGSSER